MLIDLKPALMEGPRSGSLAQLARLYPEAISFVPAVGRASPRCRSAETEIPALVAQPWPEDCVDGLNGAEVVARHLAMDLGIHVDPGAIVITGGARETRLVTLLALFDPSIDTLLVPDPPPLAITELAALLGVPVEVVSGADQRWDPPALEDAVRSVRRAGRRPRALYVSPDFDWDGAALPLVDRKALLKVAERHSMLVLEDGEYGNGPYRTPPLPRLKAMDTAQTVIYMGSFAEAVLPGLPLAFIVADPPAAGTHAPIAAALARVRSLAAGPVPSAATIEAALAGSLAPVAAAGLSLHDATRDRLLRSLEAHLAGGRGAGARWTPPSGGFFVTVRLPFAFGLDEVRRCAEGHGVLVAPMACFAHVVGPDPRVRLAFAGIDADTVDEGVRRFAGFVRQARRHRALVAQAGRPPRAGIPGFRIVTRLPGHGRAEELEPLIARGLGRRGLVADHAAWVASGLVECSLRGIDTHGLRLLPVYIAELEGGRARATPEVRWSSGEGPVRAMDAGGALGLVAGRLAATEAVALARRHGVGIVSVSNSNHFGAASVYTLLMARAGLLGIACSNSDALVAAAGGAHAALGTNPLSVAVAGEGDEVFCADLATSQVAYSRVKEHIERGWTVPSDWAVTGGTPSAASLALKPLGGYKGQCLAMIVEILSSILAGGPRGDELTHLFTPPFSAPRRVGHLLVALDPAAFGDPAGCRARVSAFLAFIRGQPARPGAAVLCPGDPEAEAAAIRRRRGIPLGGAERSCLERLIAEDAAGAPVPSFT